MLFKERRRLCLSALFMYIRFVSDFVTQSSWHPAQPRTILLNNLWSSLNLFQIQYPSLLVEDDVQERNVPRLAEAEARAEPWRRGGGRQDVLQSQFPDHHDSTALQLQLQHGVQQEPGLGLLAAGHDVKSSSCSPHTRGSSQTPRDQPSLQIQVRWEPSQSISVLNLSCPFREHNLVQLFSRFGPVLHAEVIFNEHQFSKGFGFVTMARGKDAEYAMVRLQNYIVDGRVISINLATPRVSTRVVVDSLAQAEMRLSQAEKEVMRLREELASGMRLGFM